MDDDIVASAEISEKASEEKTEAPECEEAKPETECCCACEEEKSEE